MSFTMKKFKNKIVFGPIYEGALFSIKIKYIFSLNFLRWPPFLTKKKAAILDFSTVIAAITTIIVHCIVNN